MAGGLPAHPELDDNEIGAVDGPVPVIGGDHVPGPAPFPEDAAGQAAHRVQAVEVGVEQDQLVHGHPVLVSAQAVDELGGVGAPAAHHGHLDSHGAERNITR